VLTIDHPDLPKDYKKEWEENTMERQLKWSPTQASIRLE